MSGLFPEFVRTGIVTEPLVPDEHGVVELVRQIKNERASHSIVKPLPLPPAAPAVTVPMPSLRGEPLEDPVITAKGTRDDLERLTTNQIEELEEIDIDMDSGPPSRPIALPPPLLPPEPES